MKRKPVDELRYPSIADLRLFCAVATLVDEARTDLSIESIAADQGVTPPVIYGLLRRLESFYSRPQPDKTPGRPVTLIQRSRGSAEKSLTEEGRIVLRQARTALGLISRIHAFRVGGKLDLVIGVTDYSAVSLIPLATNQYAEGLADERATPLQRFRTMAAPYRDLMRLVQEGRITLGIGPLVEMPSELDGVEQIRLSRGVRPYFICHASHGFAAEIANAQRKTVTIGELCRARLFLLADNYHPGALTTLLDAPHGRGGERIEVDDYTTVIASTRAGLGAGIVPGFPHFIDRLRRERVMYAVPVEELPEFQVAIYVRADRSKTFHRQEHSLLRQVLNACEQQTEIHATRSKRFLNNLEKHQLVYSVHCPSVGNLTPEWRASFLDDPLPPPRKLPEPFCTTQKFLPEAPTSGFRIDGMVSKKSITWTATSDRGEVGYVAALSAPVSGTLVGTWSGTDALGNPTSGAIVLSPRRMANTELEDCVCAAGLGFVRGTSRGMNLGAVGDGHLSKHQVSIDLSDLTGERVRVEIFDLRTIQTIQHLLDRVFYLVFPRVSRYSYETEWILQQGKRKFTGLGSSSADYKKHSQDIRTLRDVGIAGGNHLVAKRV